MYPTEYLTHGVAYTGVKEDISQLITKPDGTKEYRIHDHLASLRTSLAGGVTNTYDYDPWGELLASTAGTAARRGFNDREEDQESEEFNLGVRKMERGRFTSVDLLTEKFPWMSGYVYADNNPLRLTDPEGMQAVPMGPEKHDPGSSPVQISAPPVPPVSINWRMILDGAAKVGTVLTLPTAFIPVIRTSVDIVTASADSKGENDLTDAGKKALEAAGQGPAEGATEGSNAKERNPAQDKMLSPQEIRKLKEAGYDVHAEKGKKSTGQIDIYKDRDGNLYIKPKGGKGPGEPMEININDI